MARLDNEDCSRVVRVGTLVNLTLVLAMMFAVQSCWRAPYPRVDRAAVHVQDGQHYLEQGQTEEALAAFERALKENPKLVEAHVGVGQVHRREGDYPTAHRSFEHATALAPTDFEANYGLALVKQLMGRVQEAVTVYLRALAIEPDSFRVSNDLAAAYLRLGRTEEAVPYAQRAVELDPESQGAWANLALAYSHSRQYEEAVGAYREALELGAPAESLLLGLADSHIRLGRYERAIAVLHNQLRREPLAVAHERLGYCQFKLRRFEGALQSYHNAMTMDEKDPAALNGIGACLMTLYIHSGRRDRDQRDEAIQSWQRSILLRPDQPNIIDLIARYRRI